MQAIELWAEDQPVNHWDVLGSLIRAELAQERVVRVDFSYLGSLVDEWWRLRDPELPPGRLQARLRRIILEAIKPAELELLQNLGRKSHRVAALLVERAFSIPDKTLATMVHEVFAELAGITDISYPYEDHKELFPVEGSGESVTDWGRGHGGIRPHSDDLYEDRAVNAMCLTVCRDTSSTPTWFWRVADVVGCLSNEELGLLAVSEAIYVSGRNVKGRLMEARKPVLRVDSEEGLGLRLDFRVDSEGPRMRMLDRRGERLLAKMRSQIGRVKPVSSSPTTGSVGLLSNYKVLHGRSALNPVLLTDGEASRILIRSKGVKV